MGVRPPEPVVTDIHGVAAFAFLDRRNKPPVAVASFGVLLSFEDQMSILPFLLMFTICACLLGLMMFLERKLRQISHHNELLTDSIASKITGNPAALKNALIKLYGANLLGRVCSAFLHSIAPGLARKEAQGKIRRLGGEFLVDYEAVYSIDERAQNLEAIERGHWKAFEWK